MEWQQMGTQEVISKLSAHQSGLSSAEAGARLTEYGKNKLADKPQPPLILRFFAQFNDFMIIILLSAAAVSFVTSILHGDMDFFDPLIILLIVAVNALLGLIQEYRAEKALDALKSLTKPHAKVMRDGHMNMVNIEDLVPGDIVVLEAGDFVPADCRLISAHNLRAEESALTGESVPSEKDARIMPKAATSPGDIKNMLFFGSSITMGRGQAIVTDTGQNTQVGRIAELLEEDAPKTPLQERLAETAKKLGIAVLIICALLFFLGVLRRLPPFDMFMTSVSLAVAAIPEGLPAIVTIMLAIGVQRMAKQNAIMRKLPAVETLGCATIICTDKTGTLTKNRMTVVEIANATANTPNATDKSYILTLMSLCNDSVIEHNDGETVILGDPTETALVSAALDMRLDKHALESETPRVDEWGFDSDRKLMTTLHRTSNGFTSVTKGAPDVLLALCDTYYESGRAVPMTNGTRRKLEKLLENWADSALRVIGVATRTYSNAPHAQSPKSVETKLTFVGLCGLMDPPRDEVYEAVRTAKRAGIRPVMVTGDHARTAVALAKIIGISPNSEALTGAQIDIMNQQQLENCINNYNVFARVSPEHKLRIVRAFQKHGHIVAMTGDGVNDAPALKAADIGCAMGRSGTDVAKAAADMVLSDDNFSTIVEAVREGRGIYDNIRKAVHFLLSCNIGEILTIFAAILLGWSAPLLAIQLLWVNLVTDSLPAIALGLDLPTDETMTQKPKGRVKSLFAGGLWTRIILEGIMIGLLALLAFAIGVTFFDTGGVIIGRTMAFATLSISQLIHAFNMHSEHSILPLGFLQNKYLCGSFIVCLALQLGVIMLPSVASLFKVTPLGSTSWLIVAGLSIMPLIIVEIQKRLTKD